MGSHCGTCICLCIEIPLDTHNLHSYYEDFVLISSLAADNFQPLPLDGSLPLTTSIWASFPSSPSVSSEVRLLMGPIVESGRTAAPRDGSGLQKAGK